MRRLSSSILLVNRVMLRPRDGMARGRAFRPGKVFRA
jgi:hypothetical protein